MWYSVDSWRTAVYAGETGECCNVYWSEKSCDVISLTELAWEVAGLHEHHCWFCAKSQIDAQEHSFSQDCLQAQWLHNQR